MNDAMMNSSQATVPAPEMIISDSPDVWTTIERFMVPPDKLDDAVAIAMNASSGWTDDEAFIGAIVLQSRDPQRGGLSVYSQWMRSADVTPEDAPADVRSLRVALGGFQILQSRNYTVEFTRQAEPMTAPTRLSMAMTPCAHFGLFDVSRENQDILLGKARKSAPASLGSPGLLAINFHRSADGRHVVNLGAWSTLDHFQELLKRPGFQDRDEYYKDIADFTFDFFDVVKVDMRQTAPKRQDQPIG